MATTKILYFLAGQVPTGGEQTDIDALNGLLTPTFEIGVRAASDFGSPNYGAGKEACDFVAGTIPTAYAAVTEYDPDAVPATVVNAASVNVINSASSKTVAGAAEVAAGSLTDIKLPATTAMVSNTNNVTVNNSANTVTKTGVAAVAAGVITKVNLAATEAIVTTGAVISSGVSGSGTTATITVAAGVISAIVLS